MSSATGGSGDVEADSTAVAMPVEGTTEGGSQSMEAGASSQAAPQTEGKRTQLKIVRENIQTLSSDIGNFRRSHESSGKRLENQIATLRSELKAHALSKDFGTLTKSNQANTKRLEKQVVTLRAELAAVKSGIAKDAARNRAKQEALLTKILAKVSAKKAPKPAKPTKSSKKR